MKYFLDTEFYEDGERIRPISIGIVCEDGRELYLELKGFKWKEVPEDHWIMKNVEPNLWWNRFGHERYELQIGHERLTWGRASAKQAASCILRFVSDHTQGLHPTRPEFYGYFADYDWVALCQLFGRMVDLPKGFPYFCMDLKQMMEERGLTERGLTKEWKQTACPDDPIGEHNALVDARWNMALYKAIVEHKMQP